MHRFARLAALGLLASSAIAAAPVHAPARLLLSAPHSSERSSLLAVASGAVAVLSGLTVLTTRQHKVSVKPEYSRGPMAALELKF